MLKSRARDQLLDDKAQCIDEAMSVLDLRYILILDAIKQF
jgi:hypothetical protein